MTGRNSRANSYRIPRTNDHAQHQRPPYKGYEGNSSPEDLMADLPLTEKASDTVYQARQGIYDVIDGKDDRLVVIIGPCSIHDTKAALEYAQRLQKVTRS